jgi:ATP/ADP translocase
MFVITAIVMTIIITIYNKINKKINLSTIVLSCLVLFILSLVFLQFNLHITFRGKPILIPVLFVWMDIVCTIPMIQFWTIAGQFFGPREAKRLFGVIGGGGSLAPMVAGMSLKPFIGKFGTDELLFVVAGLLGLVLLLVPIAMRFRQKISQNQMDQQSQPKQKKVFNPYLKSIAIVIGLSSIVSLLVDYQFKMIASTTLTDEASLASFFGSFFAAAGFLMLIIQFGFTGKILTRFGMLIGLLILPIALMLGASAILLAPVLWAGTFAKFADQTIKFTVNQSVWEILWLPVPPHRKKIGRPMVTGSITAIMIGVGGLITFILTKYIPLQFLSIISIGALSLWIWTSFRLKKQYVAELQNAVEKRQLNFDELTLDVTDSALVDTIQKALDVEDTNQQLFVLDLVKDIPLSPWKRTIREMFKTGSFEVQSAILFLTIDDEDVIPNEEIISAFKQGGLLGNKAAVVAGHRKLEELTSDLESRLSSENPDESAAAAAALLTLDSGNTTKAISILQNQIHGPDPYTTTVALQSLIEAPDLISADQISQLLSHDSVDVRAAALDLIQSGGEKSLLPFIVENLADSKTVLKARSALKHFDETEAISALAEKSRSGIPEDLSCAILNTLKHYPGAGSAMVTSEMMDRSNPQIYRESVDTLLSIARNTPLPNALLEDLEDETRFIAELAYQHSIALDFFHDDSKSSLMEDHLNHKLALLRPVLLKLGVLDQPETRVETYIHTLQSNDSGRLGFVLELLEQIFTVEEREIINPLIEPMDISDRVLIGRNFFPDLPKDKNYFIIKGIHSGNDWTAALYLNLIFNSGDDKILSEIDWEKVNPSNLIKEVISLHSIKNGKDYSGKIPESLVLKKEELPMYSTIEKTILLKSVSLFQSIPSEDLSRIAQIAEEVHFDSGESIFKAGEFGDSMYIIMNGSVKIHLEDQPIATLDKGECLGEMALLDQDPRSADATVEENVILLKISGDAFYEIMSGNMDIMQGIVKLLTSRLRSAIQ